MLSGIVGNTTDVLVLIVLFGASIFIHEFGHFIAAVKLGLVVDTFSIGFGPAIWKKKIKGILFKISWFPLGGYVALPQLDPSGMSRIQGVTEDGKEIERELPSVSGWRKIIVSVAGAAGNVLFAVILALVIYFSPGAVTYKGTPVVASVTEESAAYTQGLRAGDEIMAVNDQKVSSWYEVNIECLFAGASNDVELTVRNSDGERILTIPLVAVEGSPLPIIEGIERKTIECLVGYVLPESSADAAGIQANDIIITFNKMEVPGPDEFIEMVSDCDEREYPIVVERDGEVLNLKVVPIYNEELERSLIGISIVKMVMPWMREKEPVAQLRADAMGIVHLLKALVTPKKSKQAAKGLGGPVAIVAALWIAIKISLFNAVGFLRFLNINLAILNLLPIPVLDGGHIMFALWEMITRRRANPKVVNILVNAFAILLISAFLFLTFRDVDRQFPKLREYVETKVETADEVRDEAVETGN